MKLWKKVLAGELGSGDAVVLLQFLVHIVDTLPYSE